MRLLIIYLRQGFTILLLILFSFQDFRIFEYNKKKLQKIYNTINMYFDSQYDNILEPF